MGAAIKEEAVVMHAKVVAGVVVGSMGAEPTPPPRDLDRSGQTVERRAGPSRCLQAGSELIPLFAGR